MTKHPILTIYHLAWTAELRDQTKACAKQIGVRLNEYIPQAIVEQNERILGRQGPTKINIGPDMKGELNGENSA